MLLRINTFLFLFTLSFLLIRHHRIQIKLNRDRQSNNPLFPRWRRNIHNLTNDWSSKRHIQMGWIPGH
jgi:hypothetical protein